jgi:predicted nicotinamide N-methyase
VRLTHALELASAEALRSEHVDMQDITAEELADSTFLGWNRATVQLTVAGEPASIHTVTSLTSLVADLAKRLEQTVEHPEAHHLGSSANDALSGPDGTGGEIWMSGVLLQHVLGTEFARPLVHGRACVELGTGTGIVSVAAARLGAASVVATDGNPVMVALSAFNADANLTPEQSGRFESALYVWGEPPPPCVGTEHGFQTVLLTDVLYSDVVKISPLLNGVQAVCAHECDILMVYEDRRPGQLSVSEPEEYYGFFEGLRRIGFSHIKLIDVENRDRLHTSTPLDAAQGTLANTVLIHAHRNAKAKVDTTASSSSADPESTGISVGSAVEEGLENSGIEKWRESQQEEQRDLTPAQYEQLARLLTDRMGHHSDL